MLNAAQDAALINDMLSNNDDNTNPYWADPSLLGTGTTVSYTHLDVYKRQV